MKCNWTENLPIKGIDSQGQSLGTKIIYCENTNAIRDNANLQIKYYCNEHLSKVKQIRKLMHKHCINRGKLHEWLRLEYEICKYGKKIWKQIIDKLESDNFDND